MKLEVISFDEESNTVSLDVDDEAKQLLMEKGLNALLMEALDAGLLQQTAEE